MVEVVGIMKSVRWIWRIVVNVLVGVSLILFIASGVLWGRSYWGSDLATWTCAWREGEGARERWVQVVSSKGRIYVDVGWAEAFTGGSLLADELLRQAERMAGRWEIKVTRREWRPTDSGSPPDRSGGWWWPIRWRKWELPDPQSGGAMGGSGLGVDHWVVAGVFLIGPIWWGVGWGRRKRVRWIREGRCGGCGYDLRGSVGGRCSECGVQSASDALSVIASKKGPLSEPLIGNITR